MGLVMRETKKIRETAPISLSEMEATMLWLYGPLLGNESLREALGYPTLGAMSQSIAQGRFPVPVFNLESRRGKFAFTRDVAQWLESQRASPIISSSARNEGGDQNDVV